MFAIAIVELEDAEVSATTHGPYSTYAKANHAMQKLYDAILEEYEKDDFPVDYSDDSDAGHFEFQAGDRTIHWFVTELSTMNQS